MPGLQVLYPDVELVSDMSPMCHKDHPCSDKREVIQLFHHSTRRLAVEPRPIAMCPFAFTSGETYTDIGDKTVWVRGGASGLDKRQCTAQITLFADGVPRVKSLLIFEGKGKRFTLRERVCTL